MMSRLIALGLVLLLAGCALGVSGVNVVDESGTGTMSPSGNQLVFEKKVAPAYPAEVRDARVQGTVQVQFVVQADGRLSELLIVKSAGPVLDRLVLDAVAQWKFKPYVPRNGKLEKLQLPFTFAVE